MVDCRRPVAEAHVADQFEEAIGRRVTALEVQAAAEAKSVKEHFAELQEFITFTVTSQLAQLKVEFKHDLVGVEQRLGARIDGLDTQLADHDNRFHSLERRLADHDHRFDSLDRRLDGHDRRFDGLDRRLDQLERKVDAHHQATSAALAEILRRLPAPPA